MKNIRLIATLLAVALLFMACPGVTPEAPKSGDKELLSFKLEASRNSSLSQDYIGVKNALTGKIMVGPLPAGTDLSAFKATFTLSDKASATIGGASQESGVSVVNFSGDVTYVITAEDGTTKNVVVSVTRTTMGMSSFTVTGTTMPSVAGVIDDTVSPRTITFHVRDTYKTEVTNMTATFAHNGTKVSIGGTDTTSPVASLDFTNTVTFKVHGQGSVAEEYAVSAVIDPVSTVNTLSSFTATVGGSLYTGTIVDTDATTGTITLKLPSDAPDITSFAPVFTTTDTLEKVTVASTPQVSGTTTNDFTSSVAYVVTAEDNTTIKTYTVTVTKNAIVAKILAVCPSKLSPYTQEGLEWIDVQIVNKAALGTGWKVRSVNDGYAINDILTALPTALVDGDIVRIHGMGYAAIDSTAKADDGLNTDRWDVATSVQYLTNYNHSVIWVEKSDGTILDCLAIKSTSNTAWVSATGLTALNNAVAQAQWPANTMDSAITIGDTSLFTGRLKTAVAATRDGNRADDFEGYQEPAAILKSLSAEPQYISSEAGGTVLLTANAYGMAGVTLTGLTADLSGFGGDFATKTAEPLVSIGNDIYTLSVVLPVSQAIGNVSVPVTLKSSVTDVVKSTVIRVITGTVPALAFVNADMEENFHSGVLLPLGTAYANTPDRNGNTTRALYVKTTNAGTANGYIASAANYMKSKGSFTKVTFWLKGTTTAKSISINLGGKYFNLGYTTGATPILPNYTGAATPAAQATGVNDYQGALTFASWTKITLDISSIDDAALTASKIAFKFGKNTSTTVFATYDIYIDDVMFE